MVESVNGVALVRACVVQWQCRDSIVCVGVTRGKNGGEIDKMAGRTVGESWRYQIEVKMAGRGVLKSVSFALLPPPRHHRR